MHSFGLAFAIYAGASTYYDLKIATLGDMKWAYGAAIVFSRLTFFLNAFPMILKSQVMGGKAGNLRANMYIYKVLSQPQILQALTQQNKPATTTPCIAGTRTGIGKRLTET